MKTIGLLGGMSWESTASYYKWINQFVRVQKGGLHSAKIAMVSVDFEEIAQLQHSNQWEVAAQQLSLAAKNIERAGADVLLICTNTMHKVAPEIEAKINIPLLHIADCTAEALKKDGVIRVGLLGTQFTMEQDFYRQRIHDNYGISVLIPDLENRVEIHKIIFEELCQGIISAKSKKCLIAVIDSMTAAGAEAIILGCTELALLVNAADTSVTLYDTAEIHAQAAVSFALGK